MKVLTRVRLARGKLPPILHIQADNCGRENKNKYFLALCATLVAHGYFTEVVVSFLIVEHTHEDIDQRFSSISGVLKRQNIDTLPELLRLVQESAPRHVDEPIRYAELCGIGKHSLPRIFLLVVMSLSA